MHTVIKAEPGEAVYHTAQRAIVEAARQGAAVMLRHNDIEVLVYPGSHANDITEKWDLRRRLWIAEKVSTGTSSA